MRKYKNSKEYINQYSKLSGFAIDESNFTPYIGNCSIFVKSAKGSEIVDQENNVYTDYCLGNGSLILGHAHRNIVLAAKKTAERGISTASLSRHEVDLAQEILRRIPSIDIIRFTETENNSLLKAISVSKTYTGKSMVFVFEGCTNDYLNDYEPKDSIIRLPYNDEEYLKKAIKKFQGNIACIIVEPVAMDMGVVLARNEFLQVLRDVAKRENIVLIFDERSTGFRSEKSCVQNEKDIEADITCLGGIIGGGFPLGAFGGKKDIIQCQDEKDSRLNTHRAFINPVVAKTGLACLRLLNDSFYKGLKKKFEGLLGGLNSYLKKNDIGAHISYYKSSMSVCFRKESVYNKNDFDEAVSELEYDRLYEYLKNNGISFPRKFNKPFFISGLHRKKDLNKLSEKLKEYFSKN